MAPSRAFWTGVGLALLGAVLVLTFLAYQQPALLLQLLNLRYCM